MGLFRSKEPSYLIPVGPDNATSKDWVILLETSTIVGPSPDKLRVARSTLEKKIVKNITSCLEGGTSLMWKDMIHEFTLYIFVLNFTNMTLIKHSCP